MLKASKAQIKRERNPEKMKKVLKAKGFSEGKVPKGNVAHHVKPVTEGGKTTKRNVRVVSKGKHKQIHQNRQKAGKI